MRKLHRHGIYSRTHELCYSDFIVDAPMSAPTSQQRRQVSLKRMKQNEYAPSLSGSLSLAKVTGHRLIAPSKHWLDFTTLKSELHVHSNPPLKLWYTRHLPQQVDAVQPATRLTNALAAPWKYFELIAPYTIPMQSPKNSLQLHSRSFRRP